MRSELKRAYWVGVPSTETDACNVTHIKGYTSLTQYSDVLNENAVSLENEKFGDRTVQRPAIVHDDNDGAAPTLLPDYGVWLEQPTADNGGLYQRPPFLCQSVQTFGRKHVYYIQRTVDPR